MSEDFSNTPNQVAESQTNPEKNGSNGTLPISRKPTTALIRALQKLQNWAIDNKLEQELLSIVDTTILQNHPAGAGSIFHCIGTDLAYLILQNWTTEHKSAAALFHCCCAYRSTSGDELRNIYRPYPIEQPAASYFPKELDTFYLLALIVARLPPVATEVKAWFEKLRLWLIVHAMERAASGIRIDENMRAVCNKLRLAHDGGNRWLEIFAELKTEVSGFERLSAALESKTNEILARKCSTNPLTRTERQTLEAIAAIARHEQAAAQTKGELPVRLFSPPQSGYFQPWQEFLDEDTTDDAEQAGSGGCGTRLPGSTMGEPDFQESPSDPEKSYAHQQLSARSILLASQEDLHYLPWSWSRPMPHEMDALRTWVLSKISSSELGTKAIATFAWLAIATANSLRRTLDITFGDIPKQAWQISLKNNCLIRLPARRTPGWTPDSSNQESWVAPAADTQTIPIPFEIADFLRQASQGASGNNRLGQLWDAKWGDSPEAAFTHKIAEVTPRITSGMLAYVLPQFAFNSTSDSVFARLISSHPRTGLPGATAYSSWTTQRVDSCMEELLGISKQEEHPPVALNGLGSRLDVLDELLKTEITKLESRVVQLRASGTAIEFHNAITLHFLLKLYASTGGRPLKDPFWSIKHFDRNELTVFINDKHSGKTRAGRLVPLLSSVSTDFGSAYLAHLQSLSTAIAPSDGQLADEIALLASGRTSTCLPLFFLLGNQDGLIWQHASEANLEALGLFDCPLPLNLFRHRLSCRLRQNGVDPEIIDAILGHAESGAATHGDRSYRVWQEDMNQVREPLQKAYETLGFAQIVTWDRPPNLNISAGSASPVLFGADARSIDRRNRTREALKSTRGIITQFLQGRDLAELAGDEITRLSRRLLTHENGLPHPFGMLRYSMFLRIADRLWKKSGKKIKFKKRYLAIEEEASPVTEDAPGSLSTYQYLKLILANANEKIQVSRVGKSDCAIHAATQLILFSRVTNRSLIRDLLQNKNIRLIKKDSACFVEHCENLRQDDPAAPVQRYRVASRTAELLNRSMDRTNTKENLGKSKIPLLLDDVAAHLCDQGRLSKDSTSEALLTALSSIVDQANFQQLPGVVAGYLGGRVPTVALEWRDWLRLRWNEIRLIPSYHEAAAPEAGGLIASIDMPRSDADELALQRSARTFFHDLRTALGDEEESDLSKSPSLTGRRAIQTKLRELIQENNGKIGHAPALLGNWLCALLTRPKGKDFLSINAVRRYFSALSPSFEQIAYSVDLDLLDEEELTELYSDILDDRKLIDQGYVLARLRDFHHWVRQHVEIEDPIWSELPVRDGCISVDTGIWTENDYLNALHLLVANENSHEVETDYSAFLLLCIHRFGLRSAEALGLTKQDWISLGGWIIVVVQNNKWRNLKTRGSRRAVPLVDQLTSSEIELIVRIQANVEANQGGTPSARLFAENAEDFLDLRRIRQTALLAIKTATGNPASNLHRGRHGAANRISLDIISANVQVWQSSWTQQSNRQPNKTSELLLGRTGPTRRAPWAVARYLGHVGTGTQFSSYLHFIADWTEELTGFANEPAPRTTKPLLDLESFPLFSPIRNCQNTTSTEPFLSVAQALKVLRMISRGHKSDSISQWLSMPPGWIKKLERVTNSISEKMNWPQKNELQVPLLLTRIREPSWDRLISAAQTRCPVIEIRLDELIQLVGASRQVLAWQATHFEAIRVFIETWNIPPALFTMYSAANDSELLTLAQESGFVPKDPGDLKNGRKGGLQIDSLQTSSEPFSPFIRKRCALVFSENNFHSLRNRYELVIALIATVTSCEVSAKIL